MECDHLNAYQVSCKKVNMQILVGQSQSHHKITSKFSESFVFLQLSLFLHVNLCHSLSSWHDLVFLLCIFWCRQSNEKRFWWPSWKFKKTFFYSDKIDLLLLILKPYLVFYYLVMQTFFFDNTISNHYSQIIYLIKSLFVFNILFKNTDDYQRSSTGYQYISQ